MAIDWICTYDGVEYRLSDLTLGEAIAVEKEIGTTWGQMVYGSATARTALMRVFLRRDRSADVVDKVLSDMKVVEQDSYWSARQDDLPNEFEGGIPLAEDGSGTDTSSGSQDHPGVGRRRSSSPKPSETSS